MNQPLCLIVHHPQSSNMQNIKGEDGDVFLNNHVDVVISYHESSEFIVCEEGGNDYGCGCSQLRDSISLRKAWGGCVCLVLL